MVCELRERKHKIKRARSAGHFFARTCRLYTCRGLILRAYSLCIFGGHIRGKINEANIGRFFNRAVRNGFSTPLLLDRHFVMVIDKRVSLTIEKVCGKEEELIHPTETHLLQYFQHGQRSVQTQTFFYEEMEYQSRQPPTSWGRNAPTKQQ